MMRIFTVALLMIFSMGARADVKILYGEKGTEKFEGSGGTIEVKQEDSKDDKTKVTVTLIVTPDNGYTMAKDGIELYATAPANVGGTRAPEVSGDPLKLDCADFKDISQKRTYTVDIDSKLALWVKEAKFDKKRDGAKAGEISEGIYYIANDNSGDKPEGSVVYNANTPVSNYYLVPADDPKKNHKGDAWFNNEFCNKNGKGDYTGTNYGDSEKPFLTTYKTNRDAAEVPSGVENRANNSIWVLKKTSDGYYYIIHAATGKYVVYEPPYKEATNRKSMHLLSTENLEDNAKFEVTKSSGKYNFRPISVSSGNRFFNVAGMNFDGYQANTGNQGDYLHNGMVGLWKENSKNSYWNFEDAATNYTIWPVIKPIEDGLKFTIEPFLAAVHSSYKIYYSFGTNEPTLDSEGNPTDANTIEYTNGDEIPFGENTLVKAIVRANNNNSKVVTYNNLKCSEPTIVNGYPDANTFTITSATTGATIYYTTDNTIPSGTSSSIENGGSFDLADNMTVIRAIAVKDDYEDSEIALYNIPKCATPSIGFDNNGKIKITAEKDTENNAITTSIRYRYGGTNPTRTDDKSIVYSAPFDLATNQTVIRAVAYANGYLISDAKILTLQKYPAPTISYVDGNVTITSADNDASIYYVIGNGKLTNNGVIATGAISSTGGEVVLENIEAGTVIQAIAWKKGYAYSSEVNYTATPYIEPCAKPTFSFSGNTLTITSVSTGAVIHYTTDGSNPTGSSTSYSGPISVSAGTTVKAIAIKDGLADSEIATYTVFKEISSWAGIDNAEGSYVLSNSFSVSETYSGTFKGIIDGQYIVITGNSFPLFDKLDGATIKNVILDNVNINSSANTNGHSGAIANEAEDSKIYNCGVLAKSGASSISGSGSVGGIVGEISGSTRVVNCFSYANIEGGDYRAGIVGKNSGTVGTGATNSRIANCMMYGDISSGGTHISPVYGGNHVSNSQNFTEYNYYLYSELIPDPTDNTKKIKKENKVPYTTVGGVSDYKDQLAIEKEDYLIRFPFYRHILNNHREMAAFFLFGTTTKVIDITNDQIEEIGHWVLEKGTNAAKYPVVEKWENNTKRITGVDISSMSTTTSATKDYQGKLITDMGTQGKLSVTVNIGTSFSKTIDLPITDMDTLRYDYTYGKVVLPFANEFSGWTRDYSKICTGWKITKVGTQEGFSIPEDEPYNFADRNNKAKDIYSTNNRYVFAQGGNYIVPYGVSSITIEANFANAYYLSDEYYDYGYKSDYTGKTGLGDKVSTSYHGRKVYTSLSTLVADLSTTNYPNAQAVVLVGNYHYDLAKDALATGKGFTLMSIDADNNQEPDYGFYSIAPDRPQTPALRFDFVPIISLGMAAKVNGSNYYPGVPIWKPRGWYEQTETTVSIMNQFELDSGNFNSEENGTGQNPCIINGGYFVQMIRSNNGNCSKVSYFKIGGNAYIKEFYPGSHSNQTRSTTIVPINVTGGQVDECFMTGYKSGATAIGPDIRFWCSGGKIGKFLGAYMDKPKQTTSSDGNVNMTAKVDQALIGRFFGGGTSQNAAITGDIKVTINNSKVDFYCGGPEFGDMSSGKVVESEANNTKFGEYYGAGFGGTSITYTPVDGTPAIGNNVSFPSASYTYGTSRLTNSGSLGLATCYKFEYLMHSATKTLLVARFITGYANFSLATTGNVTNTLTDCTIENDFYGAGCQGKVDGTVTSTLTNCTIKRSAFGGGYKAVSNEVKVYPAAAPTLSIYNGETGIFSEFGTTEPDTFTWEQGNGDKPSADEANTKLKTSSSVTLTDLGNVTGEITLTIDGGYVGGTSEGMTPATAATATTEAIPEGGNVYGGGNESKSLNNTIVTLKGDAYIYGNVFGGGNKGIVSGSTEVNIE